MTISTDVGVARNETAYARLAADAADGHPFAICLDPAGNVSLRSMIHVHDDMWDWIHNWPTAISVAQAIAAERFWNELGECLEPADPELRRPDRDEILTLFQQDFAERRRRSGAQAHLPSLRSEHSTCPSQRRGTTALRGCAGGSARICRGRMRRHRTWPRPSWPAAMQPRTARRSSHHTAGQPRRRRPCCARAESSAGGVAVRHARRRAWPRRSGHGADDLRPCRPRPGSDRDGTFTGTVLAHHRVTATRAVAMTPAMLPETSDDEAVAGELPSLATFYGEVFDLLDGIEIHATASPALGVTLRRPFVGPRWSAVERHVWPISTTVRSSPNSPWTERTHESRSASSMLRCSARCALRSMD